MWRKYVRLRAFLNSQRSPAFHLFSYPVCREEEPRAAFKEPRWRTLPLLEWTRRQWDQLTPGSSKGRLPLFSPHLCVYISARPATIWSLKLKPQNKQVNLHEKCQQDLILLIQKSSWAAPLHWIFIFASWRSFPQSKNIWKLRKSFLETLQVFHLSWRQTTIFYASESTGEWLPHALSKFSESAHFLISTFLLYQQGN